MGLFDIFKRRQPQVPLPQLCYDIAYFILPHYVHKDYAKFEEICRNAPDSVGPFFYLLACQMRSIEPSLETAKTLQVYSGQLGATKHLTLAYPVPPPVDFAGTSPAGLHKNPLVLAPYFSAVLQKEDGQRQYYILGQAPLGGGTTLRSVTPDGANCNLGPGPVPELEAFHAILSS